MEKSCHTHFRQLIAECTIMHALSSGEGPLLNICRYLRFDICLSTWDRHDLYLNEKDKMKTILKKASSRVCLSIDSRTSSHGGLYSICLTAHFIDSNWNLNRKIMNFHQVDDLSSSTIDQTVENCLLEWGIDKILTIKMDNTCSKDGDLAFSNKKLDNWSAEALKVGLVHPRCLACRVKPIVKEGLEDLNESIDKISRIASYVWSKGPCSSFM